MSGSAVPSIMKYAGLDLLLQWETSACSAGAKQSTTTGLSADKMEWEIHRLPSTGNAGCFSHSSVITFTHNTLRFLELNKPFVCLL